VRNPIRFSRPEGQVGRATDASGIKKRAGLGAVATLTAATALLAVAAPAALALPEWTPPFPKPMGITSGLTTLESVSGEQIQCVADNGTGEVTTPMTGTAKIILIGCERVLPTGKIPCNTPGLPPEQIAITAETRLGYIVHTPVKTQVGLDLFNPNLLTSFLCGETRVVLKGSVIGKLTPLNKPVKPGKPFTLKLTQSKGHQKPIKFELEPPDFPEISFGGPFESAGVASVEKITFAETVEVLG
jgi:hypothetical protein